MKPSLLISSLPLLAAAAFPATFAAQAFGLALPTAFDAAHMFGVFVIALTLQTLLADYRRTELRPLVVGDKAAKSSHSMFPLAA